jgi:hypothetical protein
MGSISKTWGTTAAERELVFPCDRLIARPDGTFFRGVTIEAPARIIFRWLCQMRVAPYSYDWLDNGGRQSPRELTVGLEELASGQTVMRIFDLVDFARNEQLTIRLKPQSPSSKVFGDIAVSYLIIPTSGLSCRLVVKLVVKNPYGIRGRLMGAFLPWGDLIMMRRQLLNFKRLAEESKASSEF